MRISLRNLLLWGAAVTTANTWGQAPTPHQEVDLAVTYTAQRSSLTTGNFFWRQGGSFELSTEMYRGLGIVINVAGSEVKNIQGSGIDLDTLTTIFGPRYTWHHHAGKVAVFGQGQIGESHGWNSLFPATGGATSDFNTFALQVGGGLDLRLGRHFAVRPVQADWIRTQFPNGTTNVQNNLRLGAGMVLRIPQSR